MPDLPECKASRFRNSYHRGAALITGNRRYCDLIDPDHPDYDPAIAADYDRMSAILDGREPDPLRVNPFRSQRMPLNWPKGIMKIPLRPDVPNPSNMELWPRPGMNPGRSSDVRKIQVRMFSDETTHQNVYKAAMSCEHRVEGNCCTTPDKCGPDGVRPGETINIGICYPCSADRLGIDHQD